MSDYANLTLFVRGLPVMTMPTDRLDLHTYAAAAEAYNARAALLTAWRQLPRDGYRHQGSVSHGAVELRWDDSVTVSDR